MKVHVSALKHGVIAEDAEQAHRLALPYRLAMARLQAGQPLDQPYLTIEQAEQAEIPLPQMAWRLLSQPWLIGEAHTVAEQIFELSDRFDVDEVMIQPIAGAFDADPLTSYPAREYAVRELAARLVEGV